MIEGRIMQAKDLPPEIICLILQNCDAADIIRCQIAHRMFRVLRNKNLWRAKYVYALRDEKLLPRICKIADQNIVEFSYVYGLYLNGRPCIQNKKMAKKGRSWKGHPCQCNGDVSALLCKPGCLCTCECTCYGEFCNHSCVCFNTYYLEKLNKFEKFIIRADMLDILKLIVHHTTKETRTEMVKNAIKRGSLKCLHYLTALDIAPFSLRTEIPVKEYHYQDRILRENVANAKISVSKIVEYRYSPQTRWQCFHIGFENVKKKRIYLRW